MDIQVICERIIGYCALVIAATNAILGIFRKFASAKKLVVQAIGVPFKKTRLWNPLVYRVFYT